MYSILYILLVILTYQCVKTESDVASVLKVSNVTIPTPLPESSVTFEKDPDCYVKTIKSEFDWMPIPFAINSTTPYIIHPNQDGHYHFKHNTTFKMSCVGSYFKEPHKLSSLVNEITIKCLNGFLMYNGGTYVLDRFQCNQTPRSKLVMTNKTCHGSRENKVIKVGFYSSFGFISIYKICFNTVHQSPLYSWMFMKSPFYKLRQISDQFSKYIRTSTYGRTTVAMSYSNQTNTLASILDSTALACQYIKKRDGKRYLIPSQLSAKNLLFYVFESDATFYYENTAPQWIEFNRFGWKELESMFRKNLIRGNRDHIIITGTYNVTQFADENGTLHDYYLHSPKRLPVPEFFWKMYYDVEMKAGTVFIGMNNPYRDPIDPSIFFCNTMKCPGQMARRRSQRDLVFCCSKESFERVYGKIDPFVFYRTVP